MRHSLAWGLARYEIDRVTPGGFLLAVLQNDLIAAVGKADSENRGRLAEIVAWVYNNVPSCCYGSKAKVEAWLLGETEVDSGYADRARRRYAEIGVVL